MRANARDTYLRNSLETASSGRLIVMLYDAAINDLAMAESALRASDPSTASDRLLHAQAIILELLGSLDSRAWDAAPTLASLYAYFVGELVQANVQRDPDRIAPCRGMLQDLAEAWREAMTLADQEHRPPVGARA
jgi:flagellar protein FliS